MTPMKLRLAVLALSGLLCLVSAKGKLNHDEECSVVDGVLGASRSDDDESKLCNTDKGLICTGKCGCLPTRVWDKGYIFGVFGTGNCVVAANGFCSQDDTCVSNSKCGENINLCLCNDGYHADGGMCVSQERNSGENDMEKK